MNTTILPPCPHAWKQLHSKTMFRCEMCEALGYTKPLALRSPRSKPMARGTIYPYSCHQKDCDRLAVVRGVHSAYCSIHRKRAGKGKAMAKK